MSSYKYEMPGHQPGTITRTGQFTAESALTGAAVKVGAPVKIKNGRVYPLESGDAAGDVYGFIVRAYPTQKVQEGEIQTGQPVDVLRRGYMAVLLAQGAPKKAAPVYVRVSANGDKAVGDIEADSSAEVVKIQATFMDESSAGASAEIAYNI